MTGCAGFLGSLLVDAIPARGDVVIGVDSFSDYYSREVKESNRLIALAPFEAKLTKVGLTEWDPPGLDLPTRKREQRAEPADTLQIA